MDNINEFTVTELTGNLLPYQPLFLHWTLNPLYLNNNDQNWIIFFIRSRDIHQGRGFGDDFKVNTPTKHYSYQIGFNNVQGASVCVCQGPI